MRLGLDVALAVTVFRERGKSVATAGGCINDTLDSITIL